MPSEKQSSIKIAIISRKGGVGKSALAREISFFLADSLGETTLFDCDPRGAQEEVILSDAITVRPIDSKEEIPLPTSGINIYDFPSEPDKRLKKFIKEVDLVIMPYQPEIDSIIRTIDTYTFVKHHNDQIMLVCNMYHDKSDIEESKAQLEAAIEEELFIMPLKHYTGIRSVANEGISVLEKYKAGGIYKRSYKPIKEQIEAIANAAVEVING